MCVVVAFMSIISFLNGDDNTNDSGIDSSSVAILNATPEPVESAINEHVHVYKDGQTITVECKNLLVSGDGNAIVITNSDIESILVTGDGNCVAYSRDANPRIKDFGDYNDVYKSGLI